MAARIVLLILAARRRRILALLAITALLLNRRGKYVRLVEANLQVNGPSRGQMGANETARQKAPLWQLAAAFMAITAGVFLRLWIRTPTDFWEDEIIAATRAVQPFWQVLAATIRHDVHPPLYFVQLHFWALLGESDLWLKLNSVLWSLIALVSLWWTVKTIYSGRVAFFATLVFAVLPSPIYMADQLRMYAMLATLIIWAFYFTSIVFRGEKSDLRSGLGLLALLVMIILTHAIGAIAVFSNGIYGLGLIFFLPKEQRRFGVWIAIYGAAAIAALPWIIAGAIHDANLREIGGIAGLLTYYSSTVIGQLAFHHVTLRWIGTALGLSVIGVGLSSERSRLPTVVFLIVPFLIVVTAEVFYKSVFKWNFFSTLAAPFLALVLGEAFANREHRYVPAISVLGASVLLALSIYTRLTFSETQNFRAFANLIRSNYRPDDVVYVPQTSYFWSLAWYLEGPRWGSPLAIAQRPPPQWRKIYDRLGPQLTGWLGLEPKSQILEGKYVRMVVGNDSYDQVHGSRIWMVTAPRADLKPGYPPKVFNGMKPVWSKHDILLTTLYASSPQRIQEPLSLSSP